MKINKDTWHYKLWRKSFSYGEYVPEETDLCRYCHKVFWQLVAYAALASMIVVLVVMVGMLGWTFITKALIPHPGITLGVIAAGAALITAIVFYGRWLNRGRSYSEPKTLVGKYARASKQRVCPLVEFESTEEVRSLPDLSWDDDEDTANYN